MAAVAGPQYAPEDPTLPKPWKGLLDNTTGYLYFWNPETNATQYERPALPSAGGRVSLQVQTPVLQHIKGSYNDDGDKNSRGGIGVRSHQNGIGASVGTHFTSNGASGAMPSVHVGSLGTEGGLSADAYRSRHEITVMGGNVPSPFMSFDDAGFPSEILREVRQAGFSVPTPIQAQSWPIALQGQDLVAVAKTGSGKTLGYLIPGFLHLKRNHNIPQKNPTVLVLSPTRELATQIQDEAVKFGRTSRISCVCLYGGAPKGPQLRDLDRGVDIVVATPGRLNDILEMRRVNLNQVSYLVLDEADRMLDMGFEPQIRKIISEVPSRRQTLMFTATWPKEVRKIAADLLVNPVQVNIGNINELVANKAITQFVEVVPPMEKQRRLEQILRSQEPGSKIIIFCATKKMCDNLARNVTRQFRAAAIHGDKSQGERDYVLNQFKTGRSPVLVATDVAARGLDIKDIRVVVNYDFPTGIEDYVHRIGRTGRAGATGLAYTFLSEQDAKYAADLVKILEGSNQQVPPEVRQMALRGGGMRRPNRWSLGGGGRGGGGGGRGGGYDSGRGRWGSSGGRFEGRGGQDRFNNRGYGGDSGGSGRGGYSSFRSKNRSPSPSHKYGGRSRSRSMERF